MHTVHSALIQGREVFAVPGRVGNIGSEGPHAILREGARIVTSAQDLMDDLGISPSANKPSAESERIKLNEVQQKIVSQLKIQEATPQEVSELCDIPVQTIMTELGTLEILGVVIREAGNRFHLPLVSAR